MTIVEICCGSYYDCLQAYRGGATRVELNSALALGGLTPSMGSLELTLENTELKAIAMVRPRAGGFHYSQEDFDTMKKDTKILLEKGAHGIAFGILNEDATIDINRTQEIIKIIQSFGKDKEIVFHRAFDCVPNVDEAILTLIDLGVHRILTSGQEEKAVEGKALIKRLIDTYGNQIEILPGSGLNESNAKQLISETGVNQIHSSCKDWLLDNTTIRNHVSYAYHLENDYEVVCMDKVVKIIESVN